MGRTVGGTRNCGLDVGTALALKRVAQDWLGFYQILGGDPLGKGSDGAENVHVVAACTVTDTSDGARKHEDLSLALDLEFNSEFFPADIAFFGDH